MEWDCVWLDLAAMTGKNIVTARVASSGLHGINATMSPPSKRTSRQFMAGVQATPKPAKSSTVLKP
jgi:hypothetical protein